MPQLTDNIFDELHEIIKGDVYTDKLRRYMHSTDGSIYRVEPSCVVYPKDEEDVKSVIDFALKYGLSVHPRGAGSGLCGSAIGKGIVIDFMKYMNRLLEVNYEEGYFVCEPGYRFGELEKVISKEGFFFPPDPSSGEYTSFGGMFGTNASGAHSVKYGNVSDYVLDADIILSNGEKIVISEVLKKDYDELDDNLKRIYDLYEKNKEKIESAYPPVKYNVTGYNLRELVKGGRLDLSKLFCGAEGTLGIATKLKFKIIPKPKYDSLIVAYFDDIIASAEAVQLILPMGPSGIEIMDKSLLKIAKDNDETLRDKIPDGIDNVLLIEFDSFDKDEARLMAEKAKALIEEHGLTNSAFLAVEKEEKEKFWAIRKAAVPILYKLKGRKKILALIEDAAVPTDKLVEYFKGLYALLEKHKVDFVIYGHIAKGLLHTRPLLDLQDPHDIDYLKILADEVFELVNSLDGAISGEHGDGRIRSYYIEKQYPEIYHLFKEVKNIFDENSIFNPEIITHSDPYQVKKFLRFGKDYRSYDLPNKLLVWSEGFLDEVEKCHGCSKCTTVTEATRMCPIYKFTRDEAAAPKAKANILRALVSGAIDDKALFDKAFQYVINHCVNCGSCYKECPSNVNIPKMAMEARAQYVKKFGAGIEKKLVVSVELAARTTRKISPLLEKVMKPKIVRKINELFTGLAEEREFIAFKSKSLFEQVEREEGAGDKSVLYFTGCYAGYIEPNIGLSTIKLLKAIGYKVYIPDQHCCGLPMISKGMVDSAKKKVKKNLSKWGNLIDKVDYIVVSCSSCGLSLLQEWGYLLNTEEIEKIKSKVVHITKLLNDNLEKLEIKPDGKKYAYHMPCHLKAQKYANSSIDLMQKSLGYDIKNLNSHCCGIAGSWGLSAENYDLSMEIASDLHRKLNDSNAEIAVTDCPTCRIQMEHISDKHVLHPVEVLAKCLKD
ncbi:anaerobic glycerol-3-phosphate dehydrogenase subunit C [Deferribacter autotrophicus]|uniref:Anaerobic glycerol-3-phosphate dehydrogenase subunit C n=2 Tax=Deferribacter autotrophicus TaxID=500465 RepID=A0A5A8F4J0_9BACT|nr:anaerobic glycerol-3-phosphate dehydrogenase subunit C [Deferribacter autotrophicus]